MAPANSRPSFLDKLYCLLFVVFAEVEGRLDADKLTPALATVQAEDLLLRARIATVRAQRWFKAVPQAAAPLQAQVLKQSKFWLARGKAALQPARQLPGYDPSPAKARKVRVLAFELDAASPAALRGALTGGLTDRDLGLYIATFCTVHYVQAPPQFWPLVRETRDGLVAILDAG